jgi:hypothetical protein
MMKLDRNCPPIEDVLTRVFYNPETGLFTALKSAGRRRAGDVCGYADRLGYIKVAFDGKWVMAHRLAFRIVHGRWPIGEIDHINGNPSDNRIANLRECTRSQNVMNTRRGNGVCYRADRKKWQVIVKAAGVAHWGGSFDDESAARRTAAEMTRRLHGEFANIEQPKPEPKQEGFDL